MSVRKEVADQLRADNPSFLVVDFPASPPANIGRGKVWVNVYRERFEVAENNGHITHHLKVLVAVPLSLAPGEDELDDAIDAVMLTLEGFQDVYWQTAERTIIADAFQGFEVSVQAIRSQTYKSQLLTS